MAIRSCCALYSGGKDSTRAIELVQNLGLKVSCLVTIVSQNQESYMLHTAAIDWTRLSAEALGIPIVFGSTHGRKEEELVDIRGSIARAMEEYDFDSIVSGGMASMYQKERIEKIAMGLGLESLTPLWGVDQSSYLAELVESKYSFILTSVSAEGLDKSWLGKEITRNDVTRIREFSNKYRFNAAFEGGEAETLVLDCPLFKLMRLEVCESSVEWNGVYGKLNIKRMKLVPKSALV
ncbi:MAG: diphthine--ammonia ligase [Nitrososphaerales archaeon]